MDLVKHCRAEHVPNVSRQIRLGSLSDFRTIENKAICDENEGIFKLSLHFDGRQPFELKWLREITFGARHLLLGPGATTSHSIDSFNIGIGNTTGTVAVLVDNIVCNRVDETFVYLNGTMDLVFYQHDRLIFCMTKQGGQGSVINDDEYTDVWCIAQSEIADFSARLGELAVTTFTTKCAFSEKSTGPFIKPVGWPPPEIEMTSSKPKFVFEHGHVEYRDRNITVKKQEDISREMLLDIFSRAAFIKPLEFEKEEEYRFTFQMMVGDGTRWFPIPYNLEPVIVGADNFLELISDPCP